MKKCKFCKKEIDDKTKKCPYCRSHIYWSRRHPILSFLIFIFAIAFIINGLATALNENNPSNTSSSSQTKQINNSPELELKNWKCNESYGYMITEGEVKNISDKSLDNVQAVISFYTKDDKFITSDSALIEYNPILSGQTSPFKVTADYNPEMVGCNVEFKYLMGGTIQATSTANKK